MDNSGYTVVNINGEEIGLHFGVPASRMFYEKLANDEFMVSGNTINEIGIATVLHCGYINNCMLKDLAQTKTFGYFLSYVENGFIDDDIKKQLERISKTFSESRYTKKITDQVRDHLDDKKKQQSQTGI